MTTCLALEIGQHADPEVAIPHQLFQSYLGLIPELRKHGMALEQIWRSKCHRLKAGYRWQVVTTMIDAIIATLFDMGWKAHWPWKRIDDQGTWWHLNASDPKLPSQLLEVLRQSLYRRQHLKMANHCYGLGAERGLDLTCIKRYIKHQSKHDSHKAGRAKVGARGHMGLCEAGIGQEATLQTNLPALWWHGG